MRLLVFVYGLVVGSFLNVCIFRIPEGMSVVSPPSSCGNCGHRLNFYDMIPVLNYIINNGRCRYCNASYSIQYPIVELLNAVLYVLVVLKYGLSFYSDIYCLLSSLLIIVCIIDFKYMIIPDKLNIFGLLIGVVVLIIDKHQAADKLFGVLMGFSIFAGIAFFTGAMGGGDIKLIAVLGFIFGLKGIFFITVGSFLIGAVICGALLILKLKNIKDKIPFGPFICMAALLYIFFGNEMIAVYLNFITL